MSPASASSRWAVWTWRTAACKARRKVLGVGGIRGDLELQTDLVKMGARFIIAGSDVTYLMAAAKKDADTLRAIKVG